jgi:flagellar biosynthesis/type III secretory pathway M-ring protein FliF/YscJ
MSVLVVVLTLVLLAAVIVVVSRPLLVTRTLKGAGKPADTRTGEHADLEEAREAKYREIRDAELDYRTGKLSREDYEAVNGALRVEALAILDRLEALAHEPERASREPVERDPAVERDPGEREGEDQAPGSSK